MLKKTLIAATALSAVTLGAASPASAHYKGHYNFSWYAGYPSWSYSICHYETRPLTLKIWDPYTYSYYFKTVYRDVRICGCAGPKIAPLARPNEGCRLSPRLQPFFYLLAKIEHLAAAQHGFGPCRVASVLLMQHEPRQESGPGSAPFPPL